MWSWAILSSASVVTPAFTRGVRTSSTSEASRPAMRMPAMSASFLIEIVIVELSHRGLRIAGFHRGRPTAARRDEARSPDPFEPPALTTEPQHLARFEGGNALPGFRAAALLARLQVQVARIDAIGARFVHWVWSDAPLARGDADRLEALLRYGDPARPIDGTETIVVAPRLGTISPWASKATDIARNCGLVVHRIERVTEFALLLKKPFVGRAAALDADERAAVAALLHDRMTECVFFDHEGARHLFDAQPARPSVAVDVLAGGRAALDDA